MRHITANGLGFVKQFEKCILVPYNDGYGYMTIGYGHLIKPGEVFERITPDEALRLLAKDMEKAEIAVLRLTKVPLEDYQFDALVSLTFNAGAGAYQRSRIRMAVNREDHDEVARLFPLSFVTSRGVVSKGLKRRRQAEARIYEEGSY